jgi:hypothetical protein
VCRLARHAKLSEMLPLQHQHGVTFLFANDVHNAADFSYDLKQGQRMYRE